MAKGDRKRKWKGLNGAEVKKLRNLNKRVRSLEEQLRLENRNATEEEVAQLRQPSQQTLTRREQAKRAKRNGGRVGTEKHLSTSAPSAKQRNMCRPGLPREANGNFGSFKDGGGYENFNHDDDDSVDAPAFQFNGESTSPIDMQMVDEPPSSTLSPQNLRNRKQVQDTHHPEEEEIFLKIFTPPFRPFQTSSGGQDEAMQDGSEGFVYSSVSDDLETTQGADGSMNPTACAVSSSSTGGAASLVDGASSSGASGAFISLASGENSQPCGVDAMSNSSTEKFTVSEDYEGSSLKCKDMKFDENNAFMESSSSVNVLLGRSDGSDMFKPFYTQPLPASTFDSTGQSGVMKVSKGPLTISISPQLHSAIQAKKRQDSKKRRLENEPHEQQRREAELKSEFKSEQAALEILVTQQRKGLDTATKRFLKRIK